MTESHRSKSDYRNRQAFRNIANRGLQDDFHAVLPKVPKIISNYDNCEPKLPEQRHFRINVQKLLSLLQGDLLPF